MLSSVCGHALMQALLTTSEQCVAETRAAGTEERGAAYLCPVSVESQWPVEMSQILMVLSSLPLATSLPSGEKATEMTLWSRQVSTWNTQAHRKTINEKLTRPSARSLGTCKRILWNLWHSYHFRAYVYQQKDTFSSGYNHRYSNQQKKHVFLLFSCCVH